MRSLWNSLNSAGYPEPGRLPKATTRCPGGRGLVEVLPRGLGEGEHGQGGDDQEHDDVERKRARVAVAIQVCRYADVMAAELAITERVPSIEVVERILTLNFVKRVGWLLNPDGTATGTAVLPPGPSP